MNCEDFKDASFMSDIFCEACGMDVGFEPIKIKHKNITQLYCCDGCAKAK